MRNFLIGLALLLGACAQTSTQAPNVTPANVCQVISTAQANATVTSTLAPEITSNSALGQVWQYAESGCNGATPAAGVDATWTQEMLTMAEQLIPVVAPVLIGML